MACDSLGVCVRLCETEKRLSFVGCISKRSHQERANRYLGLHKLQQKVLLNLPLKHYTHNVKHHYCQKKLSCKVLSEKGLVPAALFPHHKF